MIDGQTGATGPTGATGATGATARHDYARIAALVALPIALIALIPSLIGVEVLRRDVRDRCVDARVNRDAIRATVIDGLPTLGYRYDSDLDRIVLVGAPSISYYATHPDERATAVERTRPVLMLFPVIKC